MGVREIRDFVVFPQSHGHPLKLMVLAHSAGFLFSCQIHFLGPSAIPRVSFSARQGCVFQRAGAEIAPVPPRGHGSTVVLLIFALFFGLPSREPAERW